jgi:hypothetical protein
MNTFAFARHAHPARPACSYVPRPGTNAEKILNFILAHCTANGCNCTKKQVENNFKTMKAHTAQIYQVVQILRRHDCEHLVPEGFTKGKSVQQNETLHGVSVDDLYAVKKFVSAIGGIAKFKAVYEALEALKVA